jgi:hypothetical protein
MADAGWTNIVNPPPIRVSPVFHLSNADSTDYVNDPEAKALWDYMTENPYAIVRVSHDLTECFILIPETFDLVRVWHISPGTTETQFLTISNSQGHIIKMGTEMVHIVADPLSATGFSCLETAKTSAFSVL